MIKLGLIVLEKKMFKIVNIYISIMQLLQVDSFYHKIRMNFAQWLWILDMEILVLHNFIQKFRVNSRKVPVISRMFRVISR